VTPVGRGGNQGKDLNKQDADLTYLSLVAAEGACLNLLNDEEKEKGLARIREDNAVTHPNTNFTSFGWARHAGKPRRDGSKKLCSTLIIGVSTPEAVNRLVRGGIALGGSLLVCKR